MNQLSSSASIEFSSFDYHLADFISKQNHTYDPTIYLSTAVLSSFLRSGNICIDLTQYASLPLEFENEQIHFESFPDLVTWRTALDNSTVCGKPGEYKPLILDNNRLYFYRRWRDEINTGDFLLARCTKAISPDIAQNIELIRSLFTFEKNEINYQFLSSVVSLANNCCIISGGPGTGKTTTVVKILALHLMIFSNNQHIGLAAPTGKAAARLKFSIMQAIENLPCSDAIKRAIPSDAVTIHRLLLSQQRNAFTDAINSETADYLPYSILVIDEASMIDLSLMSQLIKSIRPDCKVILLGDKDQLSSVEAGSVLGDICDCGKEHAFTEEYTQGLQKLIPEISSEVIDKNLFANNIVTLKKSYRFNSLSGIGRLSKAINDGAIDDTYSLLNDTNQTECIFRSFASDTDFTTLIHSVIRDHFKPMVKASDPDALFSSLDNFRILCAVRDSIYGVESINKVIISNLKPHYQTIAGDLYHGLPVMITANDYKMNVFNGDTGVVVSNKLTQSKTMVAFRNQDNSIKYIFPGQLRHYEAAYAMTIHKSQGSEFNNVLIILPPVKVPVLTRELLYTAVTRAKQRVEIWGTHEALSACVNSRIVRSSGLRERLWGGNVTSDM